MWILTSLGRPDRIRKLVDSYAWGDHSSVYLTLYDGDSRLEEYLAHQWPVGWQIEVVKMMGNGPTYNEMLRRYPDEACYGFLADDQLLEAPGMLRALENAAGSWNVAYANDKHHGPNIPTMPCMGGELVRAVGYLSPPYIVHWGIDCCWYEIGKRLDALRYQEHLTYEHQNPVWGTAPDDRTYRLARQRSFGYEDLFRAWLVGGELGNAVHRAKQQRGATAIEPRGHRQSGKPLCTGQYTEINATPNRLAEIVHTHDYSGAKCQTESS